MSERGRYIALEGFEGTGKSTQAKRLATHLDAVLTREPGATALGAHLRDMLLRSNLWPNPRTEALLFCADRAQHIAEIVAGELAKGRHVVTDRSYGSTLAYQGHGRGVPIDELRLLVEYASRCPEPAPAGHVLPDVLLPDVVVLLEMPLADARQRIAGVDPSDDNQLALWRDDAAGAHNRKDNFEDEDHRYLERVCEGLALLCEAEPERWVSVDATGSKSEVAARVRAAVAAHPAMAS
ncbi:dTMP kinase [Candidatus Poriferisodalis sp.]|uniref:dTMP kinase n=1 Tax=Candidatus Poriferisodalis sp. TaxID=3101277 RepID=UPI003B022F8B